MSGASGFLMAVLFIGLVLYVGWHAGARWARGRRRPSIAKIMELRNAIYASLPPQFASSMPAPALADLVEGQLRTYLEFAGDMAAPRPFSRAVSAPTASVGYVGKGPLVQHSTKPSEEGHGLRALAPAHEHEIIRHP